LILQHIQDSIKRDDRKINSSEAKTTGRTTTSKTTVPKLDTQNRAESFLNSWQSIFQTSAAPTQTQAEKQLPTAPVRCWPDVQGKN